jgi:uncharacterized protein
MGIRLLFLILALAAIWMIVRFYWLSSRQLSKHESPPQLKADDMVACHHCGLHIPVDEAIKAGEHWYCCPEHANSSKDDD